MLISISNFQEFKVDKIKRESIVSKIEVIDLNNSDRYRKLSQIDIARKAFFIFFANPIVVFFKIVFQASQMAFDTFDSFVLSWFRTAGEVSEASGLIAFAIIIAKSYIIPKIDLVRNLAQGVIFIIRNCIYGIAMQFASIFMLLERGNLSRKIFAKLEFSLNYNLDRASYDYRESKLFNENFLLTAILITIWRREQSIVYYLAPCLQPIGKLNDGHIIHYQKA
jgi:hypothetical protein